jgi:GNAT superfamily N-acetyltransferase
MNVPLTSILCHTLDRYVGETLTPEVAASLVTSVLRQVYPGAVDISGIEPLRAGGYVIAPVRAREVLEDLKELHKRHWEETEGYRHGLTLNPDYARGLEVEEQGRLLLLGVIHMDTQQLVGNYGFYLSRSMHTQKLMATEDTLYILPEHRRGRLAVQLIRYAESALRHLGVEEVNVTVKKVNQVAQMMERLGYKPVATQLSKVLSDEKENANVQL